MTKQVPPEELYEESEIKAGDDGIKAMAERFKIRKEDVVFAMWKMGKDLVWAQLERYLRYKKEEEKYLREKEKEAKQ